MVDTGRALATEWKAGADRLTGGDPGGAGIQPVFFLKSSLFNPSRLILL